MRESQDIGVQDVFYKLEWRTLVLPETKMTGTLASYLIWTLRELSQCLAERKTEDAEHTEHVLNIILVFL